MKTNVIIPMMLPTIIPIVISLSIFCWYFFLVIKRYGVQKSISHSYLLFPQNEESYYTIFMWGITIPLLFVHQSLLIFLAVMFLCIDGAARTGSGDKITQFLHNWGAQLGMGLGILMLGVNFKEWYLTLTSFLFIGGITLWFKNTVWWIETICYIIIISGIIIGKLF
jgi:hypothetical protein